MKKGYLSNNRFGSFFLFAVSLFIFSFFSLTVTAQPTARPDDEGSGTNSSASDDEIYKVVNACMNLQYDLSPGWVPSDTDKAALYLNNAVHEYGKKRVVKWVARWIKGFSRVNQHMTLLETLTGKGKDIYVINRALEQGVTTYEDVADDIFLELARTRVTDVLQQKDQ